MSEDLKKNEIQPEARQSIWSKWKKNIKDWIWYMGEHPHWYDINITDIKNLGEAVYNRYEDIIVDTKESNKWYIGAAMNILSWKIVNQDVTLE